jgi:hypothetical protein
VGLRINKGEQRLEIAENELVEAACRLRRGRRRSVERRRSRLVRRVAAARKRKLGS